MRKYVCRNCGFTITHNHKLQFCPNCGQAALTTDHAQARKYAEECISRCRKLAPRLEAKYAAFMALYVAYEDDMQVLRKYKERGIVTEDEMPTLFKPRLADSLKEYRRKKREGQSQT